MTGKQLFSMALLLSLSALGLLNLIAAAIYGAVFMTRSGHRWVSLEQEPFSFCLSVALSLICFVGLGGLGALMIGSARAERRHLDLRVSQPRFEDSSHTSEQS